MMRELDPIERIFENTVTEMSASELVSYIKTYLWEMHRMDLPIEGVPERKTIESFQRRYGKEKAGKIIQWVCLHKQARKDGQYITTSVFSTKMKWWTDMMFLELQQHEQRHSNTSAKRVEVETGFADLRDLAR